MADTDYVQELFAKNAVEEINRTFGKYGFATVAAAEAATATQIEADAPFVRVLGYYAAGDGGDAVYATPVAADPGATDQIFIASIGMYFRRVHERGAVDLIKHGLIGDGTADDTAKFNEAVALANSLGLHKITAPAGKAFKVINANLPNDIEIDLNGSAFYADFNGTIAGGSANILNTIPANNVSVTLRNMEINGQYDQTVTGLDGTPEIFFHGGESVVLDNVHLVRGGNFNTPAVTTWLDYRNQEILIYNAKRVSVKHCTFKSSRAEMLCVQSDNQETIADIESCHFDKTRHYDANSHTNSGLIMFNTSPSSTLNRLSFENFTKSCMNCCVGGVSAKSLTASGVSGSSAFDFNEAKAGQFNRIQIEDVYVENCTGFGLRLSGSNIQIKNVTTKACATAITVEGEITDVNAGAWVDATSRELYNINITNVTGEDNTDAVVKLIGASNVLPIHAEINGMDFIHAGTVNPSYSIDATHADLRLSGKVSAGANSLVRMVGYSKFEADRAIFAPRAANSLHIVQFASAEIDRIRFNECEIEGALEAGGKHIESSGSTVITDELIEINNSPTITDTTDIPTARVFRNGAISKTITFTAEDLGPRGANRKDAIAMNGVKLGDRVTATVTDNSLMVVAHGRVEGDDLVEVILQNVTATDLAPTDITVDISVERVGELVA